MTDYEDPGHVLFEGLMHLKYEHGRDVEAALAAFTQRRHEVGERMARRRAELGEPEPEFEFHPVGTVSEDPGLPEAQRARLAEAILHRVRVDLRTGAIIGGRQDHKDSPMRFSD